MVSGDERPAERAARLKWEKAGGVVAKDPASLKDTFQVRCQEFMNQFNFNWGRVSANAEQIAMFLFASFEPKIAADMQAQMFLSNALNNLSYQPNGKAVLRGKVWPRGEKEPDKWTIEAVDDVPNLQGSPGLFGQATIAEIYIDNVSVRSNDLTATAQK